jgi:peptidoglycan endopeptidase LytE
MKKILTRTLTVLFLFLLFSLESHADNLANVLKKLPEKKISRNSSVVKVAKKYLGTRYKLGASTRTTRVFDCSSFVKHVIKRTKHKNLPRTAASQYKKVKKVKHPRVGDLVFFKNTYKRGVSHVGIYIGNNKFIHASSGARKVTISSLKKKYYKKHFKGFGRV